MPTFRVTKQMQISNEKRQTSYVLFEETWDWQVTALVHKQSLEEIAEWLKEALVAVREAQKNDD